MSKEESITSLKMAETVDIFLLVKSIFLIKVQMGNYNRNNFKVVEFVIKEKLIS